MANKILIKSGNGAPADGVLDTAELGFDKTNEKLYIGKDGKSINLSDLSASNITSGTLSSDRLPIVPVSKGGTGVTSYPQLLSAMFPTNDATPTYVLCIDSGYVAGYSSMANLRNAIGLGSTTGTLAIANGGTGASTAADARTALGALGVNDTAVEANKLSINWVTGSLLDFATACEVGETYFVTSADTTDLPNKFSNYNYGTGYVMKRSNNFIYIELHPYNTSNSPTARNTYNNGDWYGWTYDYSEANKPTASDVGALPASGGTLTGDLSINNSILLSSSSQGGNIQIIPPSSYSVNYWEADAYNGNLRIFAQNSDGSYVFPLTLRSDGGMGIGGNLFINNNCYGTSLPAAGSTGRIFFKKVT